MIAATAVSNMIQLERVDQSLWLVRIINEAILSGILHFVFASFRPKGWTRELFVSPRSGALIIAAASSIETTE